MVRFEDTDPRPCECGGTGGRHKWGCRTLATTPRRADVSPGFARQRAERQRIADEEGRVDRIDELGRGLASLIPKVSLIRDARAEAAGRYPLDGADPDIVLALRDAYVAGWLDREAQR